MATSTKSPTCRSSRRSRWQADESVSRASTRPRERASLRRLPPVPECRALQGRRARAGAGRSRTCCPPTSSAPSTDRWGSRPRRRSPRPCMRPDSPEQPQPRPRPRHPAAVRLADRRGRVRASRRHAPPPRPAPASASRSTSARSTSTGFSLRVDLLGICASNSHSPRGPDQRQHRPRLGLRRGAGPRRAAPRGRLPRLALDAAGGGALARSRRSR